MMKAGIPISISSDAPPYMMDLVQKYLGLFDKWIADFNRTEA